MGISGHFGFSGGKSIGEFLVQCLEKLIAGGLFASSIVICALCKLREQSGRLQETKDLLALAGTSRELASLVACGTALDCWRFFSLALTEVLHPRIKNAHSHGRVLAIRILEESNRLVGLAQGHHSPTTRIGTDIKAKDVWNVRTCLLFRVLGHGELRARLEAPSKAGAFMERRNRKSRRFY